MGDVDYLVELVSTVLLIVAKIILRLHVLSLLILLIFSLIIFYSERGVAKIYQNLSQTVKDHDTKVSSRLPLAFSITLQFSV